MERISSKELKNILVKFLSYEEDDIIDVDNYFCVTDELYPIFRYVTRQCDEKEDYQTIMVNIVYSNGFILECKTYSFDNNFSDFDKLSYDEKYNMIKSNGNKKVSKQCVDMIKSIFINQDYDDYNDYDECNNYTYEKYCDEIYIRLNKNDDDYIYSLVKYSLNS